MARKRRVADPQLGERLFGERLRPWAGGESAELAPGLAALLRGRPSRARPPRGRPVARAFTAYLGAGELDDLRVAAGLLESKEQRRVSRSEVVRRAIRHPRASLERPSEIVESPQ